MITKDNYSTTESVDYCWKMRHSWGSDRLLYVDFYSLKTVGLRLSIRITDDYLIVYHEELL